MAYVKPSCHSRLSHSPSSMSWPTWLFIFHATIWTAASDHFLVFFPVTQHPIYLTHSTFPSLILFISLLSSLLFPHFMKAGIFFVLFTSDSPAPRAFSVKHEEGNQETVVEWVCLTGQKCFTLDLSHNKYIGNIDYFFLSLLLLCNYMMPSVTCAIIHIWRKKRKVFQFLPLIFTPNMGYAFPSIEKKFDLSPILI